MENSGLFENRQAEIDKVLEGRIFRATSEVCAAHNTDVYVVGGFVRDLLLGKASKDIDFVVVGNGNEMAEAVARILKVRNVAHYKHYGTAMFRYRNREIEFVGARKESYRKESRNPVIEIGTLEDDQNRRDFTINALAISLNNADYGKLLDPFNGLKDLAGGIIRTPREPEKTFDDDPLRMLRGIRFAARFGYYIEQKTYDAIAEFGSRIGIISQERITEELNKILMTEKPSIGFRLLESTGLLAYIFPKLLKLKGVEENEGQRHKDNFYHTIEVVDRLAANSNDLWLRWAALLHDIGKPRTKRYEEGIGWTFHGHDAVGAKMVSKIFAELKLPQNEKMRFVQKIVGLHLRPISLTNEQISDSAIRRLLFEAGEDIDSLMLLCEADITSKNKEKVCRFMRNFEIVRSKMAEIEEKDRLRNWQPPISGEYIMETFGIPPCREVGIIKNAIREAILDGLIGNNIDEARELMIRKAAELGFYVEKKI
ncbi:MAG: CCA tRNA nucleotidyltransferase [Bacteroidetes bacterium]|nr:CCA tRNA nucleotidyltransferase [Bacteroidota bacterium]MBU1720028.1 CCA tRNA nucleotidyltransferase [Bacteroidota bacterium]